MDKPVLIQGQQCPAQQRLGAKTAQRANKEAQTKHVVQLLGAWKEITLSKAPD